MDNLLVSEVKLRKKFVQSLVGMGFITQLCSVVIFRAGLSLLVVFTTNRSQ